MNHVCPNCGYCSHCGRGGNWPIYPMPYQPQPYPQPIWITPQSPFSIGTGTLPQSQISGVWMNS